MSHTKVFSMQVSKMIMSKEKSQELLIFLRMMSKKGFFIVLKYVKEQKNISYNKVLKHAMDKKIVESMASITIILNGLTNLGLLERSVLASRPIRTNYSVTRNGQKVIKKFMELESLF